MTEKRPYRLFTHDRKMELIDLWNSGKSVEEIAQAVGFRSQHIYKRLREVKAEFPDLITRASRPFDFWTDAEVATLKRMNTAMKTDEEIAHKLSRPLFSVYSKRKRLKLKKPRFAKSVDRETQEIVYRPYKAWTDAEDAVLRRMFAENKYDEQIADALDRSASSVEARRRKLGLKRKRQGSIAGGRPSTARGDRVSAAGRSKVWTQEEHDELVRMNNEGVTDQEIADAIGRTKAAVTSYRLTRKIKKPKIARSRQRRAPQPRNIAREPYRPPSRADEQRQIDEYIKQNGVRRFEPGILWHLVQRTIEDRGGRVGVPRNNKVTYNGRIVRVKTVLRRAERYRAEAGLEPLNMEHAR